MASGALLRRARRLLNSSVQSAPSVISAPVIVGIPTVGVPTAKIQASMGGNPTPTLTSYQYKIDGVAVGSVNTAYTPVAGDIGKALTVSEVWTNTVDYTTATSAAVTVQDSSPLAAGEIKYTYLGYGAVPDDRVDAAGRIVLQKHASAQIIFCDPVDGNDAWDGLSGVWVSGSHGPKKRYQTAWNALRNGYGDWLLIAAGTDASSVNPELGFVSGPRVGLSAQYPTLVSTYDKTDWTNTSKYRQGTYSWNASGLYEGEWTLYTDLGATGYKIHKWMVFENMRAMPTAFTGYAFAMFGPGDGVLFENTVGKYKGIKLYTPRVADATKDDVFTNFCLRRVGLWHGLDLNYHDEIPIIEPIFDRCIFHQGGYIGDNRADAGQGSHGPSIFNHNLYVYGRNVRVQRCLSGFASSFGLQARQGCRVYRSGFIRNPNHVVISAASTDTNQKFTGVDAVFEENVICGSDYVDGVSGNGGWGMAFNYLTGTSNFRIRKNIIKKITRDVSNSAALATQVVASQSTSTYRDRFKYVTLTSTAAITSIYTAMTGQTTLLDTEIYEIRGNVVLLRYPYGSFPYTVGEVLKQGSTTIGTITQIVTPPQLTFDGALSDFDNNIIHGCGTAGLYQDTSGGGGVITTINRTNNVWDNEAASGSNVTYASQVSGYPYPERDDNTYAASLGYANSKAWLDYAVQHPEIDWAMPFISYINAGYNRTLT